MPGEIILARIIIEIDLEFERALHYHNEGYDSDNDYDLPGPFMRPVHVNLVSVTEAFLSPQTTRGTRSHLSIHTKVTKG